MGIIRVTPDQLAQISSQVNSGASSIESQLASLGSTVSTLQGEWQGAAEAQFESLWQQWQKGASDIQQALTGISNLLNKAAQSYEETESAIAQSFSS